MLLKEVAYYRPETVEDAIEMLRSNPAARPLAGGQSLLNVMKHRIASPEVLVDLGGVPNLSFVEIEDDGTVRLGAMTTYDEMHRSEALKSTYPTLSRVAGRLADQQVRNRGTLGGNLCYSDPTSNLPPLMVVTGATMVVAGPSGERRVAAEEFFRGAYEVDLGVGELLTEVRLPAPRSNTGVGFEILRVNADGWGLVHASAAVEMGDGAVADCRVALGCVADRPVRATAMEEALRGREPTPENVKEAAAGLGEGLDPISDAHATADYRRRMAGVMARRAVLQAVEEARG
jgi:carbon-monoxide dehydrogenase medium subunit